MAGPGRAREGHDGPRLPAPSSSSVASSDAVARDDETHIDVGRRNENGGRSLTDGTSTGVVDAMSPQWARCQRTTEQQGADTSRATDGSLAESPRRVGKALRFNLEGLCSARGSDYRIIDRIEGRVTVIAVEHGPTCTAEDAQVGLAEL